MMMVKRTVGSQLCQISSCISDTGYFDSDVKRHRSNSCLDDDSALSNCATNVLCTKNAGFDFRSSESHVWWIAFPSYHESINSISLLH